MCGASVGSFFPLQPWGEPIVNAVTLSVVIPAYNEEHYILQCLDALLAQRDQLHEIIVVDNNSTDRTPELVRRVAEDNPVVKIVVERTPGVAAARNAGFDAATGHIIGRIDADTRVRHDWATVLRDYFAREASAEVGAVCGLNNSYDSPFRTLKRVAVQFQIKRGLVGGDRSIANLHGANMAIRKSTWDKVRGKASARQDIHEDMDLALCIVKEPEHIRQLSDLWVDISPRRALTSPIAYTSYAWAGVRTFQQHNFRGARTWFVVYLHVAKFWIAHALIWLPHRAYDPGKGRFSVRSLLGRPSQRSLPVSGVLGPDTELAEGKAA